MTKLESISMAEEKIAPTATAVLEKPAPVIPGGLPAGKELTTPQTLSLVPESVARRITKRPSAIGRWAKGLFGGGEDQPGQQGQELEEDDGRSGASQSPDASGNGGSGNDQGGGNRRRGGDGRDRDPDDDEDETDDDGTRSASPIPGAPPVRWQAESFVDSSAEDRRSIRRNRFRRVPPQRGGRNSGRDGNLPPVDQRPDGVDPDDEESSDDFPDLEVRPAQEVARAVTERRIATLTPDILWDPNYERHRRETAIELLRFRRMTREERYSPENRPRLKAAYQRWIELVDIQIERARLRKPANVEIPEVNQEVDASGNTTPEPRDPLDIDSFERVVSAYNNLLSKNTIDSGDAEIQARLEAQISRYFKEAKRVGLFEGINNRLNSLFQRIDRTIAEGTADSLDTERQIEEERQLIIRSGQRVYRDLVRSDPESRKLAGVLEAYIDLAIDNLSSAVSNRNTSNLSRPPIEGAFALAFQTDQDYQNIAEGRDIHWRPNYASYYTVTARTRSEFEFAVMTFLQWVKTVGKAPTDLYEKVKGFKDALTAQAAQTINDKGDRVDVEDLALFLDGNIGVFGAANAVENYEDKNHTDFMGFLNKDFGPRRMLILGRSHGGKTMANIRDFDMDPGIELLFSPFGEEGELSSRDDAQGELEKEIVKLLIEEKIGLVIKDYHPQDPTRRTGFRQKNLNRLTAHQSKEEFRDLFVAYTKEEQDTEYTRVKAKDPASLTSLEKQFIAAIETRHKVEKGESRSQMSAVQKRIYDEAANAFNLTLDIYSAFGERAKRSGAIFLIKREIEGVQGEVTEYMPSHNAEKVVQTAMTWTKIRFGDDSEVWQHIPHIVPQQLLHILDKGKPVPIKYDNNGKPIGVAFDRDGGVVFDSAGNRIKGLPKDVVWSKAAYSRGRVREARRQSVLAIRKYGYDVKLFDYSQFKVKFGDVYDSKGKRITVDFDNEGKPTNLTFDIDGAIVYDSAGNRRRDVRIDASYRVQPMTIKRPGLNGIPEQIPIGFKEATDPNSFMNRWTGHTYWDYQEEDRALLLRPRVFEAAMRIREGLSRPEDEDMLATQLLILDPTLSRIRIFENNRPTTILLVAGGGEGSYRDHWTIRDDLFSAFSPRKWSNYSDIRISYGLQDRGGSRKIYQNAAALVAENPNKYARRGRSGIIEKTPIHIAGVEIWGQSGMSGALEMYDYGDGDTDSDKIYKLVGKTATDKFNKQFEYAAAVFETLITSMGRDGVKEGFFEKPTNNSDLARKMEEEYSVIVSFRNKAMADLGVKEVNSAVLAVLNANPKYMVAETQFLEKMLTHFARLNAVIKSIIALDREARSGQGGLFIEGTDVFLNRPYDPNPVEFPLRADYGIYNPSVDGQINPVLMTDRDTGSSRHTGKTFFGFATQWLLSDEGEKAYSGEHKYFQLMAEKMVTSGDSGFEWMWGKFGL